MGSLVIPVAVLLTLVVVGLAVILAVVARRALISRGLGAFDCSLRHETIRHRGAWTHGVARYQDDRLDWFRVFDARLRPSESLARRRLMILECRQPENTEISTVLPGWVVVRCGYGPVIVELAMSEGAYNGLAAWLESAPPGQHMVVT